MNLTNIMQERIIQYLRGVQPPAITSLQLALSTGDPFMDVSALVEPTGAQGYVRQSLNIGLLDFVNGVGSTTKNTLPIVFGPAVNTDWPTVSYAAVVDQNGDVLLSGALAAQRLIPVGDSFSISVDALQILFK